MLKYIKQSLLVIILLSLACGLFAAGETIYEIRIVGTKNIAPELVTSAISMRVGDPLDPEAVARSIKTLYRMGVFSDITVRSEPYRSGINLIIEVEENPVVSSVSFQGFKAIKKDKAEEISNLRIGSYWSNSAKAVLHQKLLSEYSSKGFGNVKLDVIEQELPDMKVALQIVVDEGSRTTIKQITFNGNESMDDKTLKKKMKTKESGFLRSGRFDQEKFDADLVLLSNHYKKNGYIDISITGFEMVQISEKYHELIIDLYEGQQFSFGSIDVRGNEYFDDEQILANFSMKEGDTFNQEKFDTQMFGIYSMYSDEGFIYTRVDSDFAREGQQLNIELDIIENTRAKIRQIHISGNDRTKEKVLRRQMEIAPGDYFRRTQLIRSQQNIYNLGFIDPDIGIDYDPINRNGDIDLKIHVTDRSSGMANGGVGYNSMDKIVGQFSISQNNLFGNNWNTGLTWDFGANTQNFDFSFTNPNLYDSDILLGTNLYYTRKNWSSFNYEIFTRGGTLRLGQSVPWVDRSRASVGYSFYSKKYRITNQSAVMADSLANATLIDLAEKDWMLTSAVNFTFGRDSRDNIFFPTKGSQITLYSEIAGGLLMGDFDYFKQIAQVNWYTEAWHKITFRNKWRFSYITPYGRSDDAPPDEKFYLGGTGVDGIRGYPDRSIGPIGGGTRAILYSGEIGYPIAGDQVIAVGFFDAGDSYNHLRDFNFLKFKKGIGAGIRIRSPFGLIGFDYAYGLETRSWEPHLQFGTTF
ncbi:MAG TPA: outer membrane protein assembly factor BamA [Candidatus Cloacimonetes bacterium]|nr:outer membrane protein assembly factor BamA [Candidatus Cloacimonadota bacterium]